MAVRKLDVATRKEMISRVSREKNSARKQDLPREEERRWKPLVMASTSNSPYLCHCRDVKRGFANVCPAHILSFLMAESVH